MAVSEQDGMTEAKSFHDAKSYQDAFSESQVGLFDIFATSIRFINCSGLSTRVWRTVSGNDVRFADCK